MRRSSMWMTFVAATLAAVAVACRKEGGAAAAQGAGSVASVGAQTPAPAAGAAPGAPNPAVKPTNGTVAPSPAKAADPAAGDDHAGHDHAQEGATASHPSLGALLPVSGAHVRPEPGMEPKVVFDKTVHEFGEVREGLEVPAEFTFRNEGKGPLKILNTRASCGCTLGAIEVDGKPYATGDPIAPGSAGVVKAVLRTKGFNGKKDTRLDILTNDPSVPASPEAPFGLVALQLHSTIHRPFEFEGGPPYVNLGSVSNTSSHERSLIVRSTRDEPFQIVGFDPVPFDVKLDPEPLDDKANRWKINITIPAGLGLGSFSKAFTIKTKPDSDNLQFHVIGVMRGAIDVEPAMGAIFGVVPRGTPAVKNIVLRNSHATTPMKLTDIRIVDSKSMRSGGPGTPIDPAVGAHLTLHHVADEPGKVERVELHVKPTMPAGPFDGVVVIETGVPDGPARVMLPIRGFVR